ncbi:MAG: hypothetical protein D6690_06000 [Nitrospirae bacterium]|nr:MAG: hypothetical protein D6690_06000 [Nitrospirota bacterium]
MLLLQLPDIIEEILLSGLWRIRTVEVFNRHPGKTIGQQTAMGSAYVPFGAKWPRLGRIVQRHCRGAIEARHLLTRQ